MIYKKFSQLQSTLFVALALVGTCSTFLPSGNLRAQAQSVRSQVPTVTSADKTDKQDKPENPGAPDARGAAGSRGQCPRVERPLTALVPLKEETTAGNRSSSDVRSTSKSIMGVTVAEHPTFWFYNPYELTPDRTVEFVLQDENGNDVYSTSFAGSGTTPGVIGFELPPTAAPLEVGKMYQWYFVISCEPNGSVPDDNSVLVKGWVHRIALQPSLQSRLKQATPLEKVSLYAKADIWHEAITSLAKLRRQNPDDAALKSEWTKLLQSVDLEAIAPEPIRPMLIPKE